MPFGLIFYFPREDNRLSQKVVYHLDCGTLRKSIILEIVLETLDRKILLEGKQHINLLDSLPGIHHSNPGTRHDFPLSKFVF